jgi:HAD superfamily hydrolase (TIGR01493 family)
VCVCCVVSMRENVAEILPALSSSQVDSLVHQWENAYGSAMGTTFNEKVTGAYPFSWHVSTELQPILDNLGITVTRGEYDQLVKSWGTLQPWTNTQETLKTILDANFTIGVLSNGDSNTLSNAVTIFDSSVKFSYIFSSDFPAGVFKPQHDIYDQAKNVGYSIDEIFHVAGGASDGSGARDAGLFSAVTSSKSFFHASTEGVGGTEPCFNLGDISEVPAILGI